MKNPQTARYCVKNRLKMLMYWRVHCAFSSILSLSKGLFGLEYKGYFAPKHANIDRQVYEHTQSYVHGKVQDLAKYKAEYDATEDNTERQAIQTIINQQFAQLDSSKVVDTNLRNFLVRMRGF